MQKNDQSSHDFGKDIIPAMVDNGLQLYAYRFEGYWKDVGTIESYWEANMDLLDEDWSLSLNNENWRIYTNETNIPPQYIGETAVVKHSLINSGCWVCGTVESSVLFENVVIEKNSIVSTVHLTSGCKSRGKSCFGKSDCDGKYRYTRRHTYSS